MGSEEKRKKLAYADDIKIERINKMTKLEEIEACGPEHGNDLTVIENFSLSERVRYLRSRLKFSQGDLAKKAKVSQSTVAQIESGRKDPSMSTLKKICSALDVDLAPLFASDTVHVFDMNRLRKRYKNASDLNSTLYKALGEVIRYAKEIKFIE